MLLTLLSFLYGAVLGAQVTIGIREQMPILIVLSVLSFAIFTAYSFIQSGTKR